MKLHLIEEASKAWKFASLQIGAVWSLFIAYIIADPTMVTKVWYSIPDDLRGGLPPWVRGAAVGSIALCSIVAARLFRKKPKDMTCERAEALPTPAAVVVASVEPAAAEE